MFIPTYPSHFNRPLIKLAIHYGWSLLNSPGHYIICMCVGGVFFSLNDAMVCHPGGLTFVCHMIIEILYVAE